MTIIVTGGAGFIGSNFIFYELDKHPEDRIVCLDALTYAGSLSTLQPVMDKENFRFVKLDIRDREGVYKLFEEEKPDIIVNFAAESHVDRSIENPTIFLETNIIGTSVLMDACRKYGIQRYHQVSTDEVYGDLPIDRPDLFFHEDTPIHTSSPYSTSKASADLLVMAYHRTYGLPVTISRCSNNYGPYQFPEKLIPLMIANALADKPLPVYGEGKNVRDWLYVEDHCKAIDLIIRKGKEGETYNIGGHNEMQNIQIVKLICDYLGKPYSLIEHVTDRKGHDQRYAIDPTKIHEELGWLPETMFADGIKKTIQWYLDHKDWWENIISGEYQNYYQKMYGSRKVLD
ncbi:MAG: dTDP-glucose 4,6-dehydratase [Lachnospiraceae bacterium]|jgi:dTDP-glucose 4,6-dehydratase|nr:dTDP-glucose 4,6-dehydratase [Lachnospiraceae bacterium]MCI1398414.1 dTDP-glucose 4,6-dehydratase [Lachnospiraceae bacterium]MCI1424593.1 dTDP-glucose 4,6-dehydratase [Lachnospiraceae bacterium]MCI1453301.1 dTDP-glucose 4,6-dehydratase [Lachnospiraceae bacterium]